MPAVHELGVRHAWQARLVLAEQAATWYWLAAHSVQPTHCGLLPRLHEPSRYCVAEHCAAVVQEVHAGLLESEHEPCRYEPPLPPLLLVQLAHTWLEATEQAVVMYWYDWQVAQGRHVGEPARLQVPER